MVLADHIYTDVSGKRVICGTISRLHVAEIPCLFGHVTYAFILLADIEGKFKLNLRFVHLKDNAVLLESQPLEFVSQDRLTPMDIVMQVPPFPIIEAGYYSLECWVEDHLVGSVRLQASLVRQENQRE